MREIPSELLGRPFHRREAIALGLSPRCLEGTRFVRLHQQVYRHRDHLMTLEDLVEAARLALPYDAHPTGVTRLRLLGLEHGPALPLRFVVGRDHHLALDDVFLHRTVLLPPLDEVGATPAAAYLAVCHQARTIDAIVVGDWLVSHQHMDVDEVRALAGAQPWRDGAAEAAWVVDHLVGDSRSLRESEVRAYLAFAGLPAPEPNGPIDLGGVVVHGDLWFRQFRTAVEYEGVQHQLQRGQYVADIDRYSLYRRYDVDYVQLTHEKLRTPRGVVREVHACLVRGGYAGLPPEFGATWDTLFAPLRNVVPHHRRTFRAVS
jgi:hypothetical protein